jgi:dTDP-glucose 4,6-dehydratase
VSFDEGIRRTVDWYLERSDWWQPILARRYDTGRLGLQAKAGS